MFFVLPFSPQFVWLKREEKTPAFWHAVFEKVCAACIEMAAELGKGRTNLVCSMVKISCFGFFYSVCLTQIEKVGEALEKSQQCIYVNEHHKHQQLNSIFQCTKQLPSWIEHRLLRSVTALSGLWDRLPFAEEWTHFLHPRYVVNTFWWNHGSLPRNHWHSDISYDYIYVYFPQHSGVLRIW